MERDLEMFNIFRRLIDRLREEGLRDMTRWVLVSCPETGWSSYSRADESSVGVDGGGQYVQLHCGVCGDVHVIAVTAWAAHLLLEAGCDLDVDVPDTFT
jgi:hypothetical protein